MADMRISGLASGMDIDSMVTQLMKAERMPLDKINQKKQYTEWQRDDFREMNTLLYDFDQFIFDGVGKESNFIKKTVNISDPDSVTIKNINSTVDFSGSIRVDRLASAATMRSNGTDGKTAIVDYSSTKKLKDYGITGTKISIGAITKDGKLESKDIKFNPSEDTLESLISKINKDSGVTAFYDATSNQFSLISKNTGDITTGPEITLNSDGNFLTTLVLDSDNSVSSGTPGVNASVEYNGLAITRTSNTFQINGVEFTLKKAQAGTDNAITFSSSPDVDAILDTITKFVDKYNETIDKIKKKIDEPRYKDFQPLTSEQKEAMSEKDVELWEEKAKNGTLRSDSILSGFLTNVRSDLYTKVSGTTSYSQLTQIGITTTGNYLDGGKLTIDETKLREAISKDPNAIYELFNKAGTATGDKGLAERLSDRIEATRKNIEAKAGRATSVNNTFTIGRLLDNYNDQISNFERRLRETETRYYNQFTAMEKAIQQSNSQSMNLSQYFQ